MLCHQSILSLSVGCVKLIHSKVCSTFDSDFAAMNLNLAQELHGEVLSAVKLLMFANMVHNPVAFFKPAAALLLSKQNAAEERHDGCFL